MISFHLMNQNTKHTMSMKTHSDICTRKYLNLVNSLVHVQLLSQVKICHFHLIKPLNLKETRNLFHSHMQIKNATLFLVFKKTFHILSSYLKKKFVWNKVLLGKMFRTINKPQLVTYLHQIMKISFQMELKSSTIHGSTSIQIHI